jgi:hypothetical protein
MDRIQGAAMTRLIARLACFAISVGLAVVLAGAPQTAAEKLSAYTAKAGMLTIGTDSDRPDTEIFHVAYTIDGADPSTRPVTFVFNGGPGAASIYLHLSAIGPKTIATAGDGSFPAVPARLQDACGGGAEAAVLRHLSGRPHVLSAKKESRRIHGRCPWLL